MSFKVPSYAVLSMVRDNGRNEKRIRIFTDVRSALSAGEALVKHFRNYEGKKDLSTTYKVETSFATIHLMP